MSLTVSETQTLADEINADPLTRGYAGMTDAQVAADVMTEYRTEAVREATGAEIYDAIDDAEFALLTPDEQKDCDRITSLSGIIDASSRAKTVLFRIFPAGTQTRINFLAMATRSVTRAHELGISGTVREGDVTRARAL